MVHIIDPLILIEKNSGGSMVPLYLNNLLSYVRRYITVNET